jgi:hypothetical protein
VRVSEEEYKRKVELADSGIDSADQVEALAVEETGVRVNFFGFGGQKKTGLSS